MKLIKKKLIPFYVSNALFSNILLYLVVFTLQFNLQLFISNINILYSHEMAMKINKRNYFHSLTLLNAFSLKSLSSNPT